MTDSSSPSQIDQLPAGARCRVASALATNCTTNKRLENRWKNAAGDDDDDDATGTRSRSRCNLSEAQQRLNHSECQQTDAWRRLLLVLSDHSPAEFQATATDSIHVIVNITDTALQIKRKCVQKRSQLRRSIAPSNGDCIFQENASAFSKKMRVYFYSLEIKWEPGCYGGQFRKKKIARHKVKKQKWSNKTRSCKIITLRLVQKVLISFIVACTYIFSSCYKRLYSQKMHAVTPYQGGHQSLEVTTVQLLITPEYIKEHKTATRTQRSVINRQFFSNYCITIV